MTRLGLLARSLAFSYLLAVIMTVGSERVFWFWERGVPATLGIAGWYTIATATGVALIRRYRVHSWWSLLLVVPVVAYVVEGVITPMMYSGGPFNPFFPVWFTAWHGIMSFALLVFGVRWLLLAGATRSLSLLAIGIGAFWGAWASTLWLPESRNDADMVAEYGMLEVLDPLAFAAYATTFTCLLIVAHALIDLVWPASGAVTAPTRLSRAERGVGALVLVGVTAWTFVLPWALPMFAAYAGLQIGALRRHRDRLPAPQPDLLDQLGRRIRRRALVPLALIAPAAALTYAAIHQAGPDELALRIVMYSTIAFQTMGGALLMVSALWRVRRRPTAPDAAHLLETTLWKM